MATKTISEEVAVMKNDIHYIKKDLSDIKLSAERNFQELKIMFKEFKDTAPHKFADKKIEDDVKKLKEWRETTNIQIAKVAGATAVLLFITQFIFKIIF
jgi:hypothetical protein